MSGQAQEALKVYERMLTAGALPTATTYTALISAYGKNGQLDRALQIFEDMVGLTALLQAASLLLSCMLGLIVLADWNLTRTALHRSQSSRLLACWPCQFGHAQSMCSAVCWLHHDWPCSFVRLCRCFKICVIQSSCCDASGSAAACNKACLMQIRRGCERNVITYSSLISACEKAGRWELALDLFGEMHREGCKPNVVTYNSLIAACAQGTSSLAYHAAEHVQAICCRHLSLLQFQMCSALLLLMCSLPCLTRY